MDKPSRKSHNYITVVVDPKERNVIFTTERNDHTTVDVVRKAESKEKPLLNNTKFLWLKNEGAITDKQLERK